MNASGLIRAGQASAEIGARGAELLSLRFGETELIWPGQAGLWPRRAPVLFPFCGWVRDGAFSVDGQQYRTSVHGFGPDALFEIVGGGDDHIALALRDSAATRGEFPFAFALAVDIRISETALRYDFTVRNPGEGVLPFALGFHPGFRWPFDGGARAAYRVVFEREEQGIAPQIAPGGLFSDVRLELPMEGRTFRLMDALAIGDSTAIVGSSNTAVDFVAPSGRSIHVEVENFPNWVFWSLPPAPFLCIEGWTGQGDPVGFAGDIFAKPGMIHLPSGGESRHAFEIALRG